MKKYLVTALLVFSLFTLAACGENYNTQEIPNQQATYDNNLGVSSEYPNGDIGNQQEVTPTPPANTETEQQSTTPMEQIPYENPDYITIQGQQFSTSITELDLGWSNDGVSNLTNEDIVPLKYMVNLTALRLIDHQISDITPLANLTNLTSLGLNFNQITDISPLAGLTNLVELNIGSNQIMDISPLAGLINLTDFRAHDNQITNITALSKFSNLIGLNMSSNLISDIAPLSELTNLKELNLEGNRITDISPLAGLTGLYHIMLDNNHITDWSPLDNLFPSVESPTATHAPDTPHLFAEVLSDFFVNLSTPPNLHRGRPYSYHAILVDIDGTPGMLASKWTSDNVNYSHMFPNEIGPVFVQRLFYIYDNQLHEIYRYNWWAITQARQLVRMCGVCSVGGYILLSVIDGNLVSTKAISFVIYQDPEDENRRSSYFVNHYNDILPHFGEDWKNYNQPLTLEEFNEMKAKYGLHDLITNLWELPDETQAILSMSAE